MKKNNAYYFIVCFKEKKYVEQLYYKDNYNDFIKLHTDFEYISMIKKHSFLGVIFCTIFKMRSFINKLIK